MCFRKEIGSHGINEKGLWRTHQFNKVEQFIFCHPRDSWKYYNELKKNSEEIMKKLEILPFGKKRFGELSGGQKQRVLIARALVSSPEILILDEPTASVDPTVEKEVYEILKDLNKDLTVILVSHDIGFVSSYVSRVGCLNKRLVVHHSEEISKISMTGFYERSVHILQHTCHL